MAWCALVLAPLARLRLRLRLILGGTCACFFLSRLVADRLGAVTRLGARGGWGRFSLRGPRQQQALMATDPLHNHVPRPEIITVADRTLGP